MLALQSTVDAAVDNPVHLSIAAPLRASIGSRRNPASTRAILDAAATLLTGSGLAGFSIDAIARLARCGKPTVYRWWPDKLALLVELHERELCALPAADDLALWPSDVRYFWRSTPAGAALRAIVAEAQSSADGQQRLRDVVAPYEACARAVGDRSDLARARVAQLIFSLLTDREASNFVAPA